jgi:enoyl-[acyl-carrier protein] reductase III
MLLRRARGAGGKRRRGEREEEDAQGPRGGGGSHGGDGGIHVVEVTVPRAAAGDAARREGAGVGLSIDLAGKKALVTGGSRGIGAAIAVRLAEAGADVAINYPRNKKPAEETAAAVRARGREALLVKANVADPDAHQAVFDAIREAWGSLDVLVSNAASGVIKPAMELTPKHWHWTMDINAAALLPLVQHAVTLMGDRGGHVVAVSSLGAVRAIPNYAAVGASKAALECLVRHLAVELAPRQVRVNAVSAGVVDTDALKYFPNREQMLTEGARRTPVGRLVEPSDVADAVLYLVSPLSKMVVGQTMVVDGGYSVVG